MVKIISFSLSDFSINFKLGLIISCLLRVMQHSSEQPNKVCNAHVTMAHWTELDKLFSFEPQINIFCFLDVYTISFMIWGGFMCRSFPNFSLFEIKFASETHIYWFITSSQFKQIFTKSHNSAHLIDGGFVTYAKKSLLQSL